MPFWERNGPHSRHVPAMAAFKLIACANELYKAVDRTLLQQRYLTNLR